MNKYPGIFTDNIEKTFGAEGRLWLKNLETRLDAAKKKWKLTDCQPVNNLSYNYVCTAESPDYGSVILKLGALKSEVEQEYATLFRFASDKSCRCLDFDSILQALLLERVYPGDNLYSLKSIEKQIETGAEILKAIEREMLPGDNFPRYKNQISKSFKNTRAKYGVTDRLESHLSRAESYFHELEESGLTEKILHGDFHHQNILCNSEGQWILIDPKGVIGYRTSECGRFIFNQLDIVKKEKRKHYLSLMARIFSETTGISEELILKGSYVEKILSCSWSLEGQINEQESENIMSIMDENRALYYSLLND